MLLRERIDRVAGQLGDIQVQIDQLWAELQKNKQASDRADNQVIDRLNTRIAELEEEISALQSARVADRKEIVDKMTRTVTELVGKMEAARPSGGNVSQYGVEHTVKAGQTLSEIASAYDVKMSVLIKANQLKSPDQLRVGQKLFIPE